MDSLNQHFLQQFLFITVLRLFQAPRCNDADERKPEQTVKPIAKIGLDLNHNQDN